MFHFTHMIAYQNKHLLLLVHLFFVSVSLWCKEIPERVLICGVCRNVETRLEKSQAIMEAIGNLFEDYRILVYENNSEDQTKQMLRAWAKKNPRVDIESENLTYEECNKVFVNRNEDGTFFVPEQIARARNKVLSKALSDRYTAYTYIIWMDMDFVLFPDLDGFVDTFESAREWDAVFAYGVDPQALFWDWYALRDVRYPLGSELLGNDWWYMPKELALCNEDDWYPVYSAFGGCGIYKKASIQGCSYSATVTSDLGCLYQQIITKGQQEGHPQIQKYLQGCSSLESIIAITKPMPHMPRIIHPNRGIRVGEKEENIIWRMSSFVYQFPSVCEHVPFHASMIVRGRDKLYINPKLVFRYGG